MLGTQGAGAVGAHHEQLSFPMTASDIRCLRAARPWPEALTPPLVHRAGVVFRLNATETCQMTTLTVRLVALVARCCSARLRGVIDTTQAFACSCAGISTNRALREADAVFRGTVISKDIVGRGDAARTDIRFAVDRVYKGAVYSEQVVASDHDADACGLDPDVGSTWVIFAVEGIEGEGDRAVNRLITTLCSGNLPTGIAPVVLGQSQATAGWSIGS